MLKFLFGMFFLGVILIAALPFLILEGQPQIINQVGMDAARIDQAKTFLARNDPRGLEPGEIVTQWIDERDISLGANYLLTQITEGGIYIELHPGRAYAQLSLVLPDNPIGSAVNATIVLVQSASELHVESLRLGKLTVPKFLAEPIRRFVHRMLLRQPEYRAAINSLNGLQLLEDRMLVIYQWDPALVDRLKDTGRGMLVDDALRERLLAYSSQIRSVAPTLPDNVSMVELMSPVFVLAQARGGDAVEENRAALLALSFYFSGVDVARMLGVQLQGSTRNLGKRLTLYERYDFSQHFLTSAALTLMSRSSSFADTIGLFKELDDAGGGSGFSFTDIGADRAGVIVADTATRSPQSAQYVQTFFVGRPAERDFMPDVLDLPELMPDEQFKRSYGDVGDPRYLRVIEDIEERLAATSFVQGSPK